LKRYPGYGLTMAIPDFAEVGNLPLGIYAATIAEVRQRFGTQGPLRRSLAGRMERIHALAAATGSLGRFIVFGSFVTAKPDPNDVDIFMLMNDDFDASCLSGETRLVFDHMAADAYFGCSVFWIRRLAAFGGEQATIEHWQNCRDGARRGIIEVVERK